MNGPSNVHAGLSPEAVAHALLSRLQTHRPARGTWLMVQAVRRCGGADAGDQLILRVLHSAEWDGDRLTAWIGYAVEWCRAPEAMFVRAEGDAP